MGNNSEKIKALKDLDQAMDKMMTDYATSFSKKPNIQDLEALYKLVEVDNYVDHFLEKSGEETTDMYKGANRAMAPTNNTGMQR